MHREREKNLRKSLKWSLIKAETQEELEKQELYVSGDGIIQKIEGEEEKLSNFDDIDNFVQRFFEIDMFF